MKIAAKLFLSAMLLASFFLAGCRPPELESVVMNINQKKYDDAMASAQQAVQKYPDNPEAWYYLGWLYGQKGQYKEMNNAFKKTLSLNPKAPVKFQGKQVPAEGAIENIRLTSFAQNYNKGSKAFNSARDLPTPEEKHQKYLEAVKDLLAAKDAYPERNETYRPLALAFLMAGDTTQAEKTFQDALEMQPQNDSLYALVGDFYMQAKMPDKAAQMYKKALEINPDYTQVYLALGQLASNRKDWDTAVKYFSSAMEKDPNNSTVAFNIAVIYYNQDKYKEALPYLKKTLELEPDNKQIYEVLGISYIQLKDYDSALPLLETGVEKFPDDQLLWNYMGIVYANKGMKDKAQKAFKRYKELHGAENN